MRHYRVSELAREAPSDGNLQSRDDILEKILSASKMVTEAELQILMAAGLLGASERRDVERLLSRLPQLLGGSSEPPALIHGDLWSGNLIADEAGSPALIDPAAYYGHREAELGMMTLFGGFGGRVYEAYDQAFPLEPGWRARNPIYQLYHLMNHLNLFGGSYRGQVMSIVRRHL